MGAIWTSRTRSRQPQGAVQVNWANPLSRALAVAVSGAAPGRNLASQSHVIETNNPTIAGTSKGLGISWPSTTSPGVHVGAGSLLKGSAGNYTTGLTLAVYANPSASGTRFLPLAMSDNATQPQSYLVFNGDKALSAAAGMFSYQTQGNTGAQAAGVIDGKWHLFAAVLPEGSTTPILYVDGVDVTASPSAAPSGYGADAQDVYVGGYSSGSWAVSGFFLALALGLNRGLLAAEVKALSDNPWQLFAPQRTARIYSFPTAGGAAALEGSLAASATVSAALTSAIRPAASVAASATVAAALSTSIRPAASVAASATVTAALTTAIRFASSVSASASIAGDISGAAAFASTLSTSAIVTGALTTAIRLNASLAGAATVSATLTDAAAAALEASITGRATVSASLTGGSSSIWTPASASSGTWTPASAAGGT